MRRIAMVIAAGLLAGVQAGCVEGQSLQRPMEPPGQSKQLTGQGDYLAKTAVMADEQTEGDTAVKSALEWARRYMEKSEEAERLRQQNAELSARNSELGDKAAKLQGDLEQTQKELQEASAMLLELRKELIEWKRNVLGYREEMRQAQQAQLEALRKVLIILGGTMPVQHASTMPASKSPLAGEGFSSAKGQ